MESHPQAHVKPRIAITGASSFVGFWLCREFHEQGWSVYPLCSSRPDRYSGLHARRVSLLQEMAEIHFEAGIGDGSLAAWVLHHRPEVWIHHFHYMVDYRLPTYDYERAVKTCIDPLPMLMDSLSRSGCKGVIHSGSYYEPGEGGELNTPDRTTPYARSKKAVWDALVSLTTAQSLPLSKVVCPDPIGPLENEDRLIPSLLRHARAGEPFPLRSPEGTGDHLPVGILAKKYVEAAEALLRGQTGTVRPSGWAGRNRDWIQFVNQELISRQLNLLPCLIQVGPGGLNNSGEKPMGFQNPPSEQVEINWEAFWREYADWLRP